MKGVSIMGMPSSEPFVSSSELGLPRISQPQLRNCPKLLKGGASSPTVPSTALVGKVGREGGRGSPGRMEFPFVRGKAKEN